MRERERERGREREKGRERERERKREGGREETEETDKERERGGGGGEQGRASSVNYRTDPEKRSITASFPGLPVQTPVLVCTGTCTGRPGNEAGSAPQPTSSNY